MEEIVGTAVKLMVVQFFQGLAAIATVVIMSAVFGGILKMVCRAFLFGWGLI